MNARQGRSLESERRKSEKEIRRGLFIGAKQGNKCHLINEEWETLRIPTSIATHTPPRFANHQTMMMAEPTVRYNAPF